MTFFNKNCKKEFCFWFDRRKDYNCYNNKYLTKECLQSENATYFIDRNERIRILEW